MRSRRMKVAALSFLAACSSAPRSPMAPPRSEATSEVPAGFPADTQWYEVTELRPEPAPVAPVRVTKAEFERHLLEAGRRMPAEASPREWAESTLGAEGEVNMVAEVWRGKVYSLVVVDAHSPLEPLEEGALREQYWRHCEAMHAGAAKDCLDLFKEGGPYLGAKDRRMLMLDLAIHQTWEKSKEALVKELDVGKFLAGLVWTAGLYLALWLAPEPVVSKAIAGAITLVMAAYVGVKGLHDLVDAYFKVSSRAHEAKTFDELQAAGEEFATVVGENTMRLFLLALAKLTARTVGKVPVPVSQQVQQMPGYAAAALRWQAQGGQVALAQATAEVQWVSVSPAGGLAMAMALRGSRTLSVPGYGSAIIAIRHQGGHIQVILPNGQRWHLPPGKTLKDIPLNDPLGDRLQESATRWARQWTRNDLSEGEKKAINAALQAKDYDQAWSLERLARGRWVEEKVRMEFPNLTWNRQGVDVTGPNGYDYELLAGTYSNFGMHGRRMWDTLFRMIFF